MKSPFLWKIEKMYSRFLQIDPDSSSSYFLFGPRGTGKTSWLTLHFKKALYFDLLDSDTYTELLSRPNRLNEHIPNSFRDWVVIDEIQKVPALLDEVHRLIEHRKCRFILTGSSARTLRRKGVNLLAGRALTCHLYPLTALELGKDFNLQHALQYGELPTAVTHKQPEKYLASYIKTYLREEVLQEGLTRNLPLFTRFLETASFSQGEVLNYTNIAQEIGSNRHTVTQYFDMLEDLLIAYRIMPFTKRAKRDLVLSPKFYFFDVGVYRSIRPSGPLDSAQEIDGPALETLFLQEVKAINHYFDFNYDIYYWRTRIQEEIDFVLYGKRGLHAIEIKRKTHLTAKDFKALQLFATDYPMAKLYLLYGGTRAYHEKNIFVIPFAQFLVNIKKYLS